MTCLVYKLLAAKKDVNRLDRKLKKVYNCQEKIVALEARALEELDSITSHWTNLIIPKPPKVATIPNDFVALILDIEFS